MASVPVEERTLRRGTGSEAQAGGKTRIIETAACRFSETAARDRRAHVAGGTCRTAPHRRPGCRLGDPAGVMDYDRTIIAGEHRLTASGSCGGWRSAWRG